MMFRYFFLLFFCGQLQAQQKLDVYFDFDRYDLTTQAIQTLNSWVAEGKPYKVTKLYGFCDWKGTNAYNDTLALRRVHAVYDYLKLQHIPVEKNIEIRGFGEDFKQSPRQEENRRVTLFYEIQQPSNPLPETATLQPPLKEAIAQAKVGDRIALKQILFHNHSAKFMPESEPILLELLCVMEENPTLKIEIQGHICCDTENRYAYISEARARAVYTYLLRYKIDRKRMTFKGYGTQYPLFPIPERNAQEEAANRRVEIRIVAR
jgi:outer membrane protein OmpA-like peptidoglycan-associated protein